MTSRLRRAYLATLKRTLNPLTLRGARSGHGPFSLIRHVGRRTGGEVLHRGRGYRILSVEPLSADAGLAAFGGVRAVVLRMLRRREFRLLRVEPRA